MSKSSKSSILAINAGSSSIKAALIELDTFKVIKEAQISGLGSEKQKFAHGDKEDTITVNYEEGFEKVTSELTVDAEVEIVSHRVVHGGQFASPYELTEKSIEDLNELTQLAPLHNQTSISLIRHSLKTFKSIKHLGHFDTNFHKSIPKHIYTYPISSDSKIPLRKYGFHGLNYAHITSSLSKHLNKKEISIVACHLGAGASACCIINSKSYDTSMGLTPVSGLPGATRTGDIDPSLVFHLLSDPAKETKAHLSKAEEVINKASGWKALAGTADFKEIAENEKNKMVYDLFVDRVVNFAASYASKICLNEEFDGLVFSGGLGEHSADIRRSICAYLKPFGCSLDESKNKSAGKLDIENIGEKVWLIKSDEQIQMAIEAKDYIKGQS